MLRMYGGEFAQGLERGYRVAVGAVPDAPSRRSGDGAFCTGEL